MSENRGPVVLFVIAIVVAVVLRLVGCGATTEAATTETVTVFKGRVCRSTWGEPVFRSCAPAPGAKVNLYVRTQEGWGLVSQLLTSEDGSFRFIFKAEDNQKGDFTVWLPQSEWLTLGLGCDLNDPIPCEVDRLTLRHITWRDAPPGDYWGEFRVTRPPSCKKSLCNAWVTAQVVLEERPFAGDQEPIVARVYMRQLDGEGSSAYWQDAFLTEGGTAQFLVPFGIEGTEIVELKLLLPGWLTPSYEVDPPIIRLGAADFDRAGTAEVTFRVRPR